MIKYQVEVQLESASHIARELGLEPGGPANRFLTSEVRRRSDKYVPYDTGMLKGTAKEEATTITYIQPYAHYQWKGVSKSGKPLHYGGGKLRGKYWTVRMWAAEGSATTKSLAKLVHGKAKWRS